MQISDVATPYSSSVDRIHIDPWPNMTPNLKVKRKGSPIFA